jgi:hypothetical protein
MSGHKYHLSGYKYHLSGHKYDLLDHQYHLSGHKYHLSGYKYYLSGHITFVCGQVLRMTRVRTFLLVFLGCPRAPDSLEPPDPDIVPNFLMLVSKLNACVNHLEQFPIKMYDLASGPPGIMHSILYDPTPTHPPPYHHNLIHHPHPPHHHPPGVRSAGSTLKFFKTHHLKCSLHHQYVIANITNLLLPRLTTIILNTYINVHGGFIAGVGVGKLENCPITNTYRWC